MPGSFDDIIRGVLNSMAMPRPVQNRPFGSELGPMVDDWLLRNEIGPGIAEDEMPPPNILQRFQQGIKGFGDPIPRNDQGPPVTGQAIPNNTDTDGTHGIETKPTYNNQEFKKLSPMDRILYDLGMKPYRMDI